MYYIGQHKNPPYEIFESRVKDLFINRRVSIFVYWWLFKDTKYKMPNYLSNGKQDVYLRVIDPQKVMNSRFMDGFRRYRIIYFIYQIKTFPHDKSS